MPRPPKSTVTSYRFEPLEPGDLLAPGHVCEVDGHVVTRRQWFGGDVSHGAAKSESVAS
jgi:hypothetical protein